MNLTLGTFNLFQYIKPPYSFYVRKDKFTPEQFEQKRAWVKEQILQMNCDVIGFQEVFSHDDLQDLCQECGFEYYTKTDTPKAHEKNEHILITTTVALASKYPIIETSTVNLHVPTLKKHHFQGHFKFSRKPIKAVIELPNAQKVCVYVCHFKSNRLNEFEYIFKDSHTFEYKQATIKKALAQNFSPALKQRLCETSSLFFDIQKQKMPTVLMCDLNDKEYSMSIEALSNSAYHSKRTKEKILYDAYYLYDKKIYNPHPEAKPIKRTATSYYLGVGNVLDYIFISKHFNPKMNTQAHKKVKISDYNVLDEHLKKNQNGSLLQSDHAQVVSTLQWQENL